jgi:hypothetical protein
MIQLEDRILTGERPPIPDDCVPAYRQLVEECWNVRTSAPLLCPALCWLTLCSRASA